MRLPPPPWIVGHRGAAGEAVENTLASVALAVEQGADLVEVDAQLTADGQLVAFHDWRLERLSGTVAAVEDSRWEELSALRLGTPGGRRRDRIATLGQILEVVPAQLPLVIEIKRRGADRAAILEALAPVVESRAAVLLSSFDWEVLAGARTRWPEVEIAPLGAGPAELLLAAAARLGAWSLHCPPEVAFSLLESVQPPDRPILTYTINDAAQAHELFTLGVAGIFTDYPGRLRAELAGLD